MDGIGNEERLALIKSLYGLKQSSRNWYLLVHRWLTEHKWDVFFNDECLWRKDGELLFFHVDDFHYLPVSEQSVAIPVRLHGKEEKRVSPSLEEGVPFRMGLGKLHHAVRQTRPDIAYAVSAVSSGQQKNYL